MTDSKRHFDYTGTDNLEVMLEAKRYNRYLTDQVLGHRVGRGPVLDFGAGIGTFAAMLRARDVDVHCLEIDERQCDLLHAQGFEVYRSSAGVAADSYDYLYSLNVFEHIEDDLSAAREAYRILRAGGVIYIYVPAFELLYGSMDRKVGHCRRYRRRGLEALLTRAGFEVRRSGYADALGFFAGLVYNLLPGRDGAIDDASIRIYDRFLFPLSRAIDRLASPWFGKNVWVVAQKPESEPGRTSA